ncbi:hypothetical protein VTP01DRAFT_7025 [Rhizomucor pusillus]|uniref:uncharacterized protein n=1 Tax=Rhizomucor pusillus TaxID=4840 RepID=UPI003742B3F1
MSRSLLFIGGVALDITATVSRNHAQHLSPLYTSSPGSLKQTLGGVGRNMAEAAFRTGINTLLVSAVGNDVSGKTVKYQIKALGMDTKYLDTLPNQSTAVYNAIHSGDGQLLAAVADMNIFDAINPSRVEQVIATEKPYLVCFDGNITSEVMASTLKSCNALGIRACFEPTSVVKSLKVFEHASLLETKTLSLTTPNQHELEVMAEEYKLRLGQGVSNEKSILHHFATKVKGPSLALRMLPHALELSNAIPHVITKMGEEGCLYVGRSEQVPVVKYFEPKHILPQDVTSVTGAGDSFVGVLLANLTAMAPAFPEDPSVWKKVIDRAQQAAILTLKSTMAVSPSIDSKLLLAS